MMLDHMEAITLLDSVRAEASEEEWVGKMKAWRESASTSGVSNTHLGHHKCLIKPISSKEDKEPRETTTIEEKQKRT